MLGCIFSILQQEQSLGVQSGKEYAVYTVNSLNGNEADLTLRMGGETLQMKAKKQY